MRAEEKNIFTQIKEIPKNLYINIKKTFTTNNRKKCRCDDFIEPDNTCSRAYKWLYQYYKQNDLGYLKNTYEKLKLIKPEEKELKQIRKDLNRTFGKTEYFQENQPGFIMLENVLTVLSVYDPKIGYVQGMNFIAALFCYHAEEYIAFWLMTMVIEMFEMRDLYQPNLPGLNKHMQIIDLLILTHFPELYAKFCTNKITVEMYCSSWLFSLFGTVIPLEQLTDFYDMLFQHKWTFFYKLVLAFIESKENYLLEEDQIGILLILSCKKKPFTNKSEEEESTRIAQTDWAQLIREAPLIKIDQ